MSLPVDFGLANHKMDAHREFLSFNLITLPLGISDNAIIGSLAFMIRILISDFGNINTTDVCTTICEWKSQLPR